MNIKHLAPVIAAAVLLNGCALLTKDSTQEARAKEVKALCYAAASIGTSTAIDQKPQWKPQFALAYANLDATLRSGTITGQLLRDIIASLPVKELESDTARIAIESATVLFDATVGDRLNIEAAPYLKAAAEGIRDGMRVGLRL